MSAVFVMVVGDALWASRQLNMEFYRLLNQYAEEAVYNLI